MKRRMLMQFLVVLPVTGVAAALKSAFAADNPPGMTGIWEGPWYRGMTSGRVRIEVNDGSGSIQFTNLDNFGPEIHALDKIAIEGQTFSFRTEGEKGGPLSANLKLNDAGTEMKGMGKFDGFPLRLEVKRRQ